ncbi:SsrA-binding protein [Flavobacterium noncentrifugens]|uniref:SsrA-binding protein n=2 Tax=Flavobacterium noncentrifugens TaxID=1128970 RepID=A0A1G8WFV4_9FLAO|nr:SsrA-binding protein [Flavobacterium noncentrifugens]
MVLIQIAYLCCAMLKTINILNKRARFDYEIIETFTAGIVLTGTEIKSIRLGKAQITESFCEFNDDDELFAINTSIEEYAFGNQFNHKARTERKLLLNRRELKSLRKSVETKGLTIVPLKLFTNEKGMAKLDIGLCRGKKTYDKRESLKEQDTKRDLARIKKEFK